VYTPKNCTEESKCYTYSCDSTGCSKTYLCPNSTSCTASSCNTAVGCETKPVDCTARSACELATCVEGVGCVYTPLTCNDNKNCTEDKCDLITGCSNPAVQCDVNNKCLKCDESMGACVADPCNDNINCTTDSCNSVTGVCSNIPDNTLCFDGDKCKQWQCSATTGCAFTPYACSPSLLDNCSDPFCQAFQGCAKATKVCNVSNTSAACSTAQCEQQNGNCTITEQPCAVIDTSVVVAATLGVTAVVGIVCAVLACVGLSAGGTLAVYNKISDDEINSVHNNPLFQDPAKGGDNPLATYV